MKDIKDLAKGFIETTEKAMALEKLWEDDLKFSELSYFKYFPHVKMNLNEAEEMISRIENLYKQPHFWDLLHSLPRLKLSSFYTEEGLDVIAQFLKAVENTFAPLEDLTVIPLGQSFYEIVKRALNLMSALVHFLQDSSLEGFQHTISLGDMLWDPNVVRVQLKSRFGLDDLRIEKVLSYASQLPEV
ncbi:ABCAD protein, partial [Nothoprocta ornata]|nr:ABCAD protein [Nothoprocta pentlandii]NWY06950.1 ABCAD protein [Nothoprocta ornata]